MRHGTCVSVALVAASLCTTAMAADRSKHAAAVKDEVACAVSVKELKATRLVDLLRKSKGRYELERKHGCLTDESGRLWPAVLLALPAYEGEPYAVRVAGLDKPGKYLKLRIAMLDEGFAATREVVDADFKRRGTEITADVFINPQNAGERYVLIHADPDEVGSTQWRRAMGTSLATFPIAPRNPINLWITGRDQSHELTAVDSGQLSFTLVGEQREVLKRRGK